MSKRDPLLRLRHMRDFSRKALNLTAGQTKTEMENNETLRFALTHLVELVGEAASQVPPEVQKSYPQIPWPKIISMRNRLIHGYDYVDYDILWDAITTNLPQLLAQLDAILPPEPPTGQAKN